MTSLTFCSSCKVHAQLEEKINLFPVNNLKLIYEGGEAVLGTKTQTTLSATAHTWKALV